MNFYKLYTSDICADCRAMFLSACLHSRYRPLMLTGCLVLGALGSACQQADSLSEATVPGQIFRRSEQDSIFPTSRSILPSNWNPTFCSGDTIEAMMDKADLDQRSLNRYCEVLADIREAEMLASFVMLFELLTPSERNDLIREQSRWLNSRRSHVSMQVESLGGSMERMEESLACAKSSLARANEFRDRIKYKKLNPRVNQ